MIEREELQYHIKCRKGDVGEYVLLPGDPARCELIANCFDKPEFLVQNREYRIYNGYIDGVKVSVCSTGIGGPSAVIALEELANAGARTFIRIGTCGGIDTKVCSGDTVIGMSAVRQDGTSYEYAPEGYPATADFEVTSALHSAAKKLQQRCHVGVVQAKDSFYGQHSPETKPVAPMLQYKWESWKKLHVLASEMESAALFTAAAYREVRCGAVFSTVWNQERQKLFGDTAKSEDVMPAIECAIEAIRLLIKQAE